MYDLLEILSYLHVAPFKGRSQGQGATTHTCLNNKNCRHEFNILDDEHKHISVERVCGARIKTRHGRMATCTSLFARMPAHNRVIIFLTGVIGGFFTFSTLILYLSSSCATV